MKESFKQNIKNIGAGIIATVAGIAIPKEVVAEQGLSGRNEANINDKIEMVENKQQPAEVQQDVKKDSLIYNWEGDKIGFKYPFDKKYKSDEKFYRAIAYSRSSDLQSAREDAFMDAQQKLLRDEAGLTGNFEATVGPTSTIDEKTFKDSKGVFTCVVVLEIARNSIVVTKKSEQKVDTSLGKKEGSKDETKHPIERINEIHSDYRKEVNGNSQSLDETKKVEQNKKPIPTTTKDKPEVQSVQVPGKSTYYATPEDFKKAKEAEFDAYKKAKEEEFNKFKRGEKSELPQKTEEASINWPDSTSWKEYNVEEPIPIPTKDQASRWKEYKAEESMPTSIKDEKTSEKLLSEHNGIQKIEINKVSELKELLKDYKASYPVLSTFDQELATIMKNISENNLVVITSKISAKSSHVGYEHASENLRKIESVEGLKKYNSARSLEGTHRFYKELSDSRTEYLVLGLYYK